MIKFALLLLLLTAPFLSGKPLFGLPLWAWASLTATFAFAVVVIALIEKRWEDIKKSEPLDG